MERKALLRKIIAETDVQFSVQPYSLTKSQFNSLDCPQSYILRERVHHECHEFGDPYRDVSRRSSMLKMRTSPANQVANLRTAAAGAPILEPTTLHFIIDELVAVSLKRHASDALAGADKALHRGFRQP